MKNLFIITLYHLICVSFAGADFPPPTPYPMVISSVYGRYIFKIIPREWHFEGDKVITDKEAYGMCYGIGDDGEFQEQWRTKSWYTFEGYLSVDGRYFVRLGPRASDFGWLSDLAIAFYDRGKLLKEYQVKDLITKREFLDQAVDYYMWRPSIQTLQTGFRYDMFYLVTIDKNTYSFDYKTGDILEKGRDEEAKSSREIMKDKNALAKKNGIRIWNNFKAKEEFENHFTLSDFSAGVFTYGVHFSSESQWSADFTPKNKLKYKVDIVAVFPVVEGEMLEVSVTPEDILAAIKKCLKHPFVKEEFSTKNATGVRMRITGDRLHWGGTKDLNIFLDILKQEHKATGDIKEWAYFIIDHEPRSYKSIYFHPQSDIVIHGNTFPGDRYVYRVDSSGNTTRIDEKLDQK